MALVSTAIWNKSRTIRITQTENQNLMQHTFVFVYHNLVSLKKALYIYIYIYMRICLFVSLPNY